MTMLTGSARWYLMAKAKASGDGVRLAELCSEFGESAHLLFVEISLPHLHDMHQTPVSRQKSIEAHVGVSD